MGQLEFDEQAGRELEALYRTGDAVRRRRLVLEALAARPGERVADVGCGPGFVVADVREAVGDAGTVVGIDNSPQMLALAAARCAGRPGVEFRPGDAAAVPLEAGSADAAVCVQVLEYVPDVAAALGELFRIVRPGGRVVVWDVDWATVSWFSADPQRMRRVLTAWDEHLAHPSLPLTLGAALRTAGFEDVRMEAHPFAATGPFAPETYGAGISPLIARFAAGRGGVSAEEAHAWEAEQHALGEEGRYACACLQFCFCAIRP